MSLNRRRSGGVVKRRHSLNRSRLSTKSTTNKSSTLQAENSCIKVVVRARPLNDREIDKGRTLITVVDEQLLLFDPPEENEDFFFHGQKQQLRDLNKRVNKNVSFLFDRVFDGTSSNEEVFNESVKPVIDNLLSGFNCSVFAYGATGAGKTFTMLGAQSKPGIIYLIVQKLFERIEEMTTKTCELHIAYLEVYNETVKDLLTASPPLTLRDDSKSVTVTGLSYQKPTSADHLLQLLHFGNQNRTQHPTDANAESSRSHAVFQIYLKIKDKLGGLSENIQLSKMSLIDLAGSERACVVSKHGRARQREGANINQSLLALGTCINALTTKIGKTQHIPYRNSKLTRILKDSLGGNCKTVMIAAVSPSSLTYEDTYNTLRYAERAKRITVNLKRNTTQVDAHLSGYKEIVTNLQSQIDTLKQENGSLKQQLADLHENHDKRQKFNTPDSGQQDLPVIEPIHLEELTQEPKCESLDPDWKARVDILCQQISKFKKNILDAESHMQSVKARQFWRHFSHNRIAALTADHKKVSRSHNKLDTFMKSTLARTERLENEKLKNQEQYEKKMIILMNILDSENTLLKTAYIENHLSKMENSSLQSHLSHAIELSTSNFKQTCEAWKVCEESLIQVRKLQSTLKGHGFLTSDLVSKYEDLLKQAECGREVAWADNPPVPNALHQEFLQHLLLPSSGFLAPSSLTATDISSVPLTTYCLDKEKDASGSSTVPEPSTPCKGSLQVHGATFSSPSISSQVSPIYNKEHSTFRRCSPHIRNLNKLNNQELLDLINNEDVPVRRSLEETFVSSSQASCVTQHSVVWGTPLDKADLQNLTFSPVRCADSTYNGPSTFMRSTPSTERTKSVDSTSFSVCQEPHSTESDYNSHLLSEATFCTHLGLVPAVSSNGCQQIHLQPVKECFLHEGYAPASSTSNVLVAPQRSSCMLPPNSVCPATVTRPARLVALRRPPQQVGNVMPNVRNPSVIQSNLKPVSEIMPRQGMADRMQMVSSTSGPSKGAQRGRSTKENLDPQRNAKRMTAGFQKPSVTPVTRKMKSAPPFKTGK